MVDILFANELLVYQEQEMKTYLDHLDCHQN